MATKKTEKAEVKAEKLLKVTLIHSAAGCSKKQIGTVQALGLKKLNSSVVQKDSAPVRGMISKIRHLVTVEEI